MIVVKKKKCSIGIPYLLSSDIYTESAHCTSKSESFLSEAGTNSIWYLKAVLGVWLPYFINFIEGKHYL